MHRAVVLTMIGLLVAAADKPDAATLPEGCRDGITLLCADPSWPNAADTAQPVRKLTARLDPAPALAEERADGE